MRSGILVASITLNMNVFAGYPVDVYGTSETEANKILNNYAKEVDRITKAIVLNTQSPHNKHKEKKERENTIKIENLLKEIKRKYHFLYVDFSTIIYLKNKTKYFTTIEVIKKENSERMRFLQDAVRGKSPLHAKNPIPDAIDTMIQYHKVESELLKSNKLHFLGGKCPAYHCTPGFSDANLRDYLTVFNTMALREKPFILETLRHDKDPERRAAAVFLIGHLSDPKEVISLLLPSILDTSHYVRNNAMLMIATTMGMANIHQIDTGPFISFLASPYATDRNKALGILSETIESKVNKKMIKEKGGAQLIRLLQLKQPNNHDLAYLILKKISSQDYGDNISAWKNWLNS